MTEEKVNAYELSEYGREVLAETAFVVTFKTTAYLRFESSLKCAVDRLSASIEDSKKQTQEDPERLRYLESDEVLLNTLKQALDTIQEIERKTWRLNKLADRLNDTLLDCARRGWINGNDIRDIERVGFDL